MPGTGARPAAPGRLGPGVPVGDEPGFHSGLGPSRVGGKLRPMTGRESDREFDLVPYGATGFVGKLTAEYLARSGGSARIALAGRSPDRLAAVRATLGDAAATWPILTADASSPSSLDAMAERTRVVVTTVGPYSRYGLPLVASCAKAGTDYADLTGRRCSSGAASTISTSRQSTPEHESCTPAVSTRSRRT